MADQFVAEIRIVGFNFAPLGWATCDGQLLLITQNAALFSLVGTYYGGNGTSNFGLPNLQGRAPLGFGTGPGLTPRSMGEQGGAATVTLLSTEVPSHTHTAMASATSGTASSPSGATWGIAASGRQAVSMYGTATSLTAMNAGMLSAAGSGGGHNNLAPYLVLNFVIALSGIYPPR